MTERALAHADGTSGLPRQADVTNAAAGDLDGDGGVDLAVSSSWVPGEGRSGVASHVIEAVGAALTARFREGERLIPCREIGDGFTDRIWAILVGKHQLAALERSVAGRIPGLRVSYRFGTFHLTFDAFTE